MVQIGDIFRKRKKGKAGEANVASAMEPAPPATAPSAGPAEVDTIPETTLHEHKPALYSTDGEHGMKVIAEPTKADLDIIFIHGLTGNRVKTWTHKNAVFWPELLAEDIPTARIMTWGYDADPIKLWGMVSKNNIRNHGKNFAQAISNQQRACRGRPTIFIAHSLGGLVCAQALLVCQEGDVNLAKVFQSTRGIIFMGTPHAGNSLAIVGSQIAKYINLVWTVNPSLLEPLCRGSPTLVDTQQRFQQLLLKPDVQIQVYCFFEERGIRGVGVIVPEHSAVLEQYSNEGIGADHKTMTRFGGKTDEGYQKVSNKVLDIMEAIKMVNLETPSGSRGPSTLGHMSQITEDAGRGVVNFGTGGQIGVQHANGNIYNSQSDYEIETNKCYQVFLTSSYESHKNRNSNSVEGTCIWFLEHHRYLGWRDGNTSGLLWVSADPGCGKSVLSKLLADKEMKSNETRATCYFFFKDDNEDQKTATNALCAILHQLFSQKPGLLCHAKKFYAENGEALKTNIDLLWRILLAAASDPQSGDIVCIFDALDECRQSELDTLLSKVSTFYDTLDEKGSLKFLMTSRPLQRIERQFNNLIHKIPEIRLAGEEDTEQIRREINLVIQNEIDEINRDWPNDQQAIVALRQELINVEHRTYLWLKLIFDLVHQDLLASLTKTGRKKLFGTIPSSVDEAYTAILNKSSDKDQARKLLSIVCVATRPLSVEETFIAVSIEKDNKSIEDLDRCSASFMRSWIRNLCGLFVSVIDDRVYLLHQTAKEFLLTQVDIVQNSSPDPDDIWKHSLSVSGSNFRLAQSCMWYIRLDELWKCTPPTESEDYFQMADNLKDEYGFLEYSANEWARHLRSASATDRASVTAMAIDLCDAKADQRMCWELLYSYSHFEGPFVPALLRASALGLLEVVCQLLEAPGIDVNHADEHGRTALIFATLKDYEAIVTQLLMVPGINVNHGDEDGWTALIWAARDGREAIVTKLLMVPGIDVNHADIEGETALTLATEDAQEAIITQLLMVSGINVSHADKHGHTALIGAAAAGHEAITKQLLMVPGIDVNHADKDGQMALKFAARNGHEAIITQLLLVPGIDVHHANRHGQTALTLATWKGHEAIITQLLMVPGIDVNHADKDGETALTLAARNGHEALITQLLMIPSINVNHANEDGYTALIHAIIEWHEVIITQLLRVPGIDVNHTDKDGWTVLMWVTRRGLEAIITQLLMVPGINVNHVSKHGQTALTLATKRRHETIAKQLLLVPGINVNVEGHAAIIK